jgi:hypothetical protein
MAKHNRQIWRNRLPNLTDGAPSTAKPHRVWRSITYESSGCSHFTALNTFTIAYMIYAQTLETR